MTDKELLSLSYKAMVSCNYEKAIEYTNLMKNKQIAIKAHLLIIEHELSNKEQMK
jgi:hypothetical protein